MAPHGVRHVSTHTHTQRTPQDEDLSLSLPALLLTWRGIATVVAEVLALAAMVGRATGGGGGGRGWGGVGGRAASGRGWRAAPPPSGGVRVRVRAPSGRVLRGSVAAVWCAA
jgi:hypothetical protein